MTDTAKGEDIPQLTDAFHGARKMYVLFSGILMVWEFMGIRLPELEDPQLGSTFSILNNDLIVNAPDGAPVAIILLMTYFAM